MSKTQWFAAPSLQTLLNEINQRWPARTKLSDGDIGNARHQKLTSDHNPDWDAPGEDAGVVRARDFTVVDVDTKKVQIDAAEVLRHVIGDHRVNYVIWDRRIYRRKKNWKSEPYWLVNPAGYLANPHTHHIHVSLLHTHEADFDTSAWGLLVREGTTAEKPVAVRPSAPLEEDMKVALVPSTGAYFLVGVSGKRLIDPADVDEWLKFCGQKEALHISGHALGIVPTLGPTAGD